MACGRVVRPLQYRFAAACDLEGRRVSEVPVGQEALKIERINRQPYRVLADGIDGRSAKDAIVPVGKTRLRSLANCFWPLRVIG